MFSSWTSTPNQEKPEDEEIKAVVEEKKEDSAHGSQDIMSKFWQYYEYYVPAADAAEATTNQDRDEDDEDPDSIRAAAAMDDAVRSRPVPSDTLTDGKQDTSDTLADVEEVQMSPIESTMDLTISLNAIGPVDYIASPTESIDPMQQIVEQTRAERVARLEKELMEATPVSRQETLVNDPEQMIDISKSVDISDHADENIPPSHGQSIDDPNTVASKFVDSGVEDAVATSTESRKSSSTSRKFFGGIRLTDQTRFEHQISVESIRKSRESSTERPLSQPQQHPECAPSTSCSSLTNSVTDPKLPELLATIPDQPGSSEEEADSADENRPFLRNLSLIREETIELLDECSLEMAQIHHVHLAESQLALVRVPDDRRPLISPDLRVSRAQLIASPVPEIPIIIIIEAPVEQCEIFDYTETLVLPGVQVSASQEVSSSVPQHCVIRQIPETSSSIACITQPEPQISTSEQLFSSLPEYCMILEAPESPYDTTEPTFSASLTAYDEEEGSDVTSGPNSPDLPPEGSPFRDIIDEIDQVVEESEMVVDEVVQKPTRAQILDSVMAELSKADSYEVPGVKRMCRANSVPDESPVPAKRSMLTRYSSFRESESAMDSDTWHQPPVIQYVHEYPENIEVGIW